MQTGMTNVLTLLCLLLAGCQNDSGTRKPAFTEQNRTSAANIEFVKVSPDGYFLTARINGKEWVAKTMMKNMNTPGLRIEGKNNEASIGFYLWLPGKRSGSNIGFNPYNVASLKTDDDVGIWTGAVGTIVIEKVDEFFVAGSFYFTASSPSSDKKMEVTSGYFRMPLETFSY